MPSQGFLCLNEVKKIERQNKGEIFSNKNLIFYGPRNQTGLCGMLGGGKEGRKKLLLSLSL